MTATAPHLRFREARERLGLSPDEVAQRSGVSSAGVWDIEECEGDLTCCYSPRDVQQFCRVLGIRPVELFADEVCRRGTKVQICFRYEGPPGRWLQHSTVSVLDDEAVAACLSNGGFSNVWWINRTWGAATGVDDAA